ncbi:CO8A1-like protein [Mya arenaria]|uniref:CO8A1-like protein n=1 Tax=Mya arenaria TaxID=6604 RepID=A0ABY7DDA2_MYAAR|nr:collagen alpha-1(VIII) chain-like [Mya arenaria]XP_052816712.1 collagen alpha-1(VIII) chain-like [Mya arenaria]WAQ94369.1 CO8A1-like protein [Mya arenaria]
MQHSLSNMNPLFIGALLAVCLSNSVLGKASPWDQQHLALLSKVTELERIVKELQQHQSLEIRTDKDELSRQARQAELSNVRYDGGESGFYVTLDKPQEVETKMPLKFDDVVTNIGGAYDTQTGIYTAPVTGTYMFALNAVCAARNFLHLAIYKNNAPAFKVICDDLKGEIQHQGGGTTILRLQRGDRIYVTMMFPLGTVGEVRGNGMTSFSGYLLKEL